MTDETSKPKGGARHGSGRPRLNPYGGTVRYNVILTDNQRDKLDKLGGAAWIRDKIDKAKLPDPGP